MWSIFGNKTNHRARDKVIFLAVVAYFVLGTLSSFPGHYLIRRLPLFSGLTSFISLIRFDQRWGMFAPPARINTTIKVSALTPDGWQFPFEPFNEMHKETRKSLIIPRGASRVLTFFRSANADEYLKKSPLRQFFYAQLSNYYCFGDGKIPQVRMIRFYLETRGIENFYEKDRFGDPNPPATDYDGGIPIYERDCSET